VTVTEEEQADRCWCGRSLVDVNGTLCCPKHGPDWEPNPDQTTIWDEDES